MWKNDDAIPISFFYPLGNEFTNADMKPSLGKIVMILGLLASPFTALAQHHPTAPDHPLKVGDKAPEFELKDQHGNDQSLAAMLQSGKVAVIFHRSADW